MIFNYTERSNFINLIYSFVNIFENLSEMLVRGFQIQLHQLVVPVYQGVKTDLFDVRLLDT